MARTLVAELRNRDDDQLAELFRRRPDLVSPLPANLDDLGNRAATRGSVLRAVDGLDRGSLQVLDGLLVLGGPATFDELSRLLGSPPEADLRSGLERLRSVALAWGDDDALTCVATMRTIAGQFPAGVGPPAAALLTGQSPARQAEVARAVGAKVARGAPRLAELVADGQRIDRALGDLDDQSRAVLAGTTWSAPVLEIGPAHQLEPTTAEAVRRLLDSVLLIDAGNDVGVVPREVTLALRGGSIHGGSALVPPAPELTSHPPELADRIGAGAAATFVDHVDRALGGWATDPAPTLRAGGLPVRALTQVAARLGVDQAEAVLVVETAFAAGLIGTTDAVDPTWMPSAEYDRWRGRSPAERWVALARAWLTTSRAPALAGQRDERDQRIAPLGFEADRPFMPAVRRDALGVLANLEPGTAASPESVERAVDWCAPRRGGGRRDILVRATMAELPVLGLTGLGALTSYGRALAEGEDPTDLLAPLLPEPVDHLLLQADLTAVAPGPLAQPLADELRVVADVESTGGATVYRFTATSLERGLDAGLSAADLHDFLTRVSRTPVPQPLSYLVDEVARRHGRVRISPAASIIRVDDPGTADVLVGDPALSVLQLRRLAPTVLSSRRSAQSVTDVLRDAGHSAVPESSEGQLVIKDGRTQRAPAYRTGRRAGVDGLPRATLDAYVRALRVGERARSSRPSTGPRGSHLVPPRRPGDLLSILVEAAQAGETVWIGYVDNNGTTTERLVDPLNMHGGRLTAYDHLRDAVRTFAVHRITGVAPAEEDPK